MSIPPPRLAGWQQYPIPFCSWEWPWEWPLSACSQMWCVIRGKAETRNGIILKDFSWCSICWACCSVQPNLAVIRGLTCFRLPAYLYRYPSFIISEQTVLLTKANACKTNIIAPLTAADNGALAADVLFILWHPPRVGIPCEFRAFSIKTLQADLQTVITV